MVKSMSNHKTTKGIKLPEVKDKIEDRKKTLPFNGSAVTEKSFSFSFACFDRKHKLFNLGDKTSGGVVGGSWFVELMDCFKSVSNMTVPELRVSMHDLHPIDWDKTNTRAPDGGEQREYWQFRINKSKGRVIGFIIDGVFYIVWLDPHHNLTNSEGYEGAVEYKAALSTYELNDMKIEQLKQQVESLKDDLQVAEELLFGK